MADDLLEIKLPDSFFEALSEVKDSVDKGFDNAQEGFRPSFYSENVLNAPSEIQKIAPIFDSNSDSLYQNIGKSFFKGGAKVFFDYWKIFKKEEDYQTKKKAIKQLTPIINVNISDQKEPDKASTSLEKMLTILIAGGAIALAAWLGSKGTSIIAQAGETFLKSLGTLKIFDKKAWETRGNKLANAISKISKPFDWLADLIGGKGKIGSSISSGLRKVGKGIGSLGGFLAKAGASSLGRILGPLKFVPFIGTALGFYQAYLRFQKGEWLQGGMEIAAALPVVGIPLTIGLNALQSLWDADIGGAGAIKTSVKSLANIGAKGKGILGIFSALAVKLLKPLGMVLKRIPFLGSLISFGFAVKNFIDGDYIKGSLNIAAGVAMFADFIIPGLGTGIAIGLDVLNYFLTETETGNEVVNYVKNTSFSQMFQDLRNWAGGTISKYIKNVPGIGSLLRFADAVDLFEKGEFLLGLRQFAYGITTLALPGLGTGILAGLDLIEKLITGTDSTDDFNANTQKVNNNWLSDLDKWLDEGFVKAGKWFTEKIERSKQWLVANLPLGKELLNLFGINEIKKSEPSSKILDKIKVPEITVLDDELFKAREIALKESYQRFGEAAINDSLSSYKAAQEFVRKREEDLLKKPKVDFDKLYNETFKNESVQILDKRSEAVNKNLKIELENTNTKLNASNISYQEALKKQQVNIQALNTKQEFYLAKIANNIEALTRVTEEKPVAFADFSPTYNIGNKQNNVSKENSSRDPRLTYATL